MSAPQLYAKIDVTRSNTVAQRHIRLAVRRNPSGAELGKARPRNRVKIWTRPERDVGWHRHEVQA